MTDGPHKSLNMLPRWKKVAECADQDVFEQDEVNAKIQAAYRADLKEIPQSTLKSIERVVSDPEDCLFREIKIQKLEILRSEVNGQPLLQVIIDCCAHRLERAAPTPNAYNEAIAEAFTIWVGNRSRQIGEHYLRKSNQARSQNVRQRIEASISAATYQTKNPSGAKKSGLDDGVRIR